MDNIAFFNRMTLALFDKLYTSFPTPVDLKTGNIAMSIIPNGAEYDETWNSLQAAEDAIDFLAQEGFLTHKGTYSEGGTFLQARLTLKVPDALEGKQSLIDRIRNVLAGGAKEAGSETVKLLTQQAFAAAAAATPVVLAVASK
jgi:hypothetical protein